VRMYVCMYVCVLHVILLLLTDTVKKIGQIKWYHLYQY